MVLVGSAKIVVEISHAVLHDFATTTPTSLRLCYDCPRRFPSDGDQPRSPPGPDHPKRSTIFRSVSVGEIVKVGKGLNMFKNLAPTKGRYDPPRRFPSDGDQLRSPPRSSQDAPRSSGRRRSGKRS